MANYLSDRCGPKGFIVLLQLLTRSSRQRPSTCRGTSAPREVYIKSCGPDVVAEDRRPFVDEVPRIAKEAAAAGEAWPHLDMDADDILAPSWHEALKWSI